MTEHAGAGKQAFFVSEQMDLLTAVLDRVIPGDGVFPGAGELGIAPYVDRVVAQSVRLRRLFAAGLAELSVRAGLGGFTTLTDARKDAVLREVESAAPEFFEALVRRAYNGYYMDPKVIVLLGLEARPPQPRGYSLEPGELGGLERVKGRGQVYRDV